MLGNWTLGFPREVEPNRDKYFAHPKPCLVSWDWHSRPVPIMGCWSAEFSLVYAIKKIFNFLTAPTSPSLVNGIQFLQLINIAVFVSFIKYQEKRRCILYKNSNFVKIRFIFCIYFIAIHCHKKETLQPCFIFFGIKLCTLVKKKGNMFSVQLAFLYWLIAPQRLEAVNEL